MERVGRFSLCKHVLPARTEIDSRTTVISIPLEQPPCHMTRVTPRAEDSARDTQTSALCPWTPRVPRQHGAWFSPASCAALQAPTAMSVWSARCPAGRTHGCVSWGDARAAPHLAALSASEGRVWVGCMGLAMGGQRGQAPRVVPAPRSPRRQSTNCATR